MRKEAFVSLFLLLALLSATVVFASAEGPGVTADAALDMLKAGNDRFTGGTPIFPNHAQARRSETASGGQHPIVTVLSCADSRVPVEMIFDQGIGDVFVIRVAGNVSDTDEIGTAEYGIDHLNTPLFVVLGHTKCGAVTAVTQNDEVHGSIPKLVDNIIPAVKSAKAANPSLSGAPLVEASITANVWQSIEDALKNSPIIAERAKAGKVKIVGALYDIESGKVQWLGPHPKEAQFLAAADKAPGHAPDTKAGAAPSSGSSTVMSILMTAVGLAAVAAMLLFLDRLL